MPFTARVYDQTTRWAPTPRSPTRLAGSIDGVAPTPYHIIVHNLSSEGLLVESYYGLDQGREVVFDIEGLGKRAATVTWHEGSFYDCRFVEPVPASQIRAKLTSNKVVWGKFAGDTRPVPPTPALGIAPDLLRELAPRVADSPRLPSRVRLAIIVAGALLCWAPIVTLVALAMWIR